MHVQQKSLIVNITHSTDCINEWTDRVGLRRAGFLRPILHRVVAKFYYVKNSGILSQTVDLEYFATARRSRRVVGEGGRFAQRTGGRSLSN